MAEDVNRGTIDPDVFRWVIVFPPIEALRFIIFGRCTETMEHVLHVRSKGDFLLTEPEKNPNQRIVGVWTLKKTIIQRGPFVFRTGVKH